MAKLKNKAYTKELRRLQAELCRLQEWVKRKGHRVVIVFEGRDTAGKGGTIHALTERVSPRVFRVAALPAPSDREKTQLYIQRYLAHFPAAGEIARELGALAAALEGLDAIVFTGGIGEHASPVRERVCRRAAWLGVDLDATANTAGGPRISTAASRTAAWVIPTNEELVIARHTRDLLAAG
jgi:hypothetical protein